MNTFDYIMYRQCAECKQGLGTKIACKKSQGQVSHGYCDASNASYLREIERMFAQPDKQDMKIYDEPQCEEYYLELA